MIYLEERGINILYTCQCPTFLIFICRLRVRRLWFASSDKERRFLSLCSVVLGFVLRSSWDDCLIIDKKNGLGVGERSPSVFFWKLRRNRWRANLVSSKSDQNACLFTPLTGCQVSRWWEVRKSSIGGYWIWEYKVWYNLESEMGHKFKVLPFKWVMTEPKFNPRIGTKIWSKFEFKK